MGAGSRVTEARSCGLPRIDVFGRYKCQTAGEAVQARRRTRDVPAGAADRREVGRLRYRCPGTHKENLLSLGTYPDVSLKHARETRRGPQAVADGIDPSDKRKAERIAGGENFETVAREWYAKHSPNWKPGHANKVIRRLERDVFPWIGSAPVANITAPDVLAVLRRIDSRGARDTAHMTTRNPWPHKPTRWMRFLPTWRGTRA